MSYPRTVTSRRLPRPTALSCALLGAMLSPLAAAQTVAQQTNAATAQPPPAAAPAPAAPDEKKQAEELGAITVTGIRGSIQTSIEKKRDDTVVSDVLSAKDIGDLPALSIGDAIQTITGASTHREKGGATEISIRGLGPFLGTSTFNGRQVTNGSGNRSVNFDLFPAGMVNTVAIYKTQRADLVEGGISGTINMETIKPLDFGKRRVQVETLANYSADDGKLRDSYGVGWRGTASYLDQFDLGGAGRLGVSFAVQNFTGTSPEDVLSSSSTWSACDASKAVSATANCASVSPAKARAGTPYYLIAGSRTYRQIVPRDRRDARMGTLQWQPNEQWDVSFDYEYSHYFYSEDRSELNFSETMRGIKDVVADDRGALQSYSGNSTLETNSDYKVRDEWFKGTGLTVKWHPNEALTLSTDLSDLHTKRGEFDHAVRLRANATDIDGKPVPGIINGQRVNYTYTYRGGDVPGIVVDPLFNLNDWDNFSAAARARRDENDHDHSIHAARFDGTYVPAGGLFTAFKGGLRFTKAIYTDLNNRVEINVADTAAIRAANLACRTPFPQDDFLSSADGNSISSYATFDSHCLFRAITGVDDTGLSPITLDPANNNVDERTKAAYLMGEFSHTLFGLPVTGNVGARWVKTNERSVGVRSGLDVVNNSDGTIRLVSNGQFNEVVIKSQNDYLLPSLNAAFNLSEDTILRTAVYRAMARPDLSSLGAGRVFTVDSSTSFTSVEDALRNVTATGNPRAKPLLSWNADLSWEWYPNPDSMLSAAIYYKQFTGGAIPSISNETFVIGGKPVVVPVTQTTTTRDKSDLTGLELTAVHRFSYLPKPFDGLGFKLSYNYADSNFKTQDLRLGDLIDPATGIVTPGIVPPANIYGLSRNVFSGSLFYEIGPVDLQAIYIHRSEYFQKFVGPTAQNRYIRGNSTLDFRGTWRVNERLSVSVEGANLTNEPKISYMPIQGNFHEYHSYGPRYYLGVRYRF